MAKPLWLLPDLLKCLNNVAFGYFLDFEVYVKTSTLRTCGLKTIIKVRSKDGILYVHALKIGMETRF